MSGPLCPDCGWGVIVAREVAGEPGNACEFCGWRGGVLPYKKLHSHDWEACQREFAERRRRQARGELFFLRVFHDLDEDAAEDLAVSVARRFGGVASRMGSREGRPYVVLEVPRAPAPAERQAIEALPGVRQVEVR